jgi:broad specificity phosphatase PhoE
MTKLYLVRHGETVDNKNQILQGQCPGKLDEEGIRQAEELRDKLENVHIDAFVASDLQRSIHTCEIIAEPHHKTVETTPLLRERDWGDFTGMFIPDLKNKVWPDNIETLEQMKARARNFLTYLKVTYSDKTILAVYASNSLKISSMIRVMFHVVVLFPSFRIWKWWRYP